MEIKVLNKVFDLLEYAAEVSPRALLPGEAAERCNIPRSTCVRLLKLLAEKGYLEQISPRKGYTLGPAAALLNGGCYQQLSFHGDRIVIFISRTRCKHIRAANSQGGGEHPLSQFLHIFFRYVRLQIIHSR